MERRGHSLGLGTLVVGELPGAWWTGERMVFIGL